MIVTILLQAKGAQQGKQMGFGALLGDKFEVDSSRFFDNRNALEPFKISPCRNFNFLGQPFVSVVCFGFVVSLC